MSDLITRVSLPLKRRQLTVKAVTDLTPSLRRITLTGDDLTDFHSPGADDHIKVFFASADGDDLTGRDYTPRAFRPDVLELDLDFVLHEHGMATTWARNADIGDELLIGGPRGSTLVKYEFDEYFLVADDAALPALARRLEELPAGAKVTALVEVQSAAHQLLLSSDAAVQLRWLHRGEAAAGTTTLLRDAVREWQIPSGTVFVWVGAERKAALGIKKELLARGLDAETMRVTAYWTDDRAVLSPS
ncbi:siderophore-interacting protein (plasmid) [Deinococcus wulumuqiensis]|uniref:Siderophore-interacting protein n=1 Tax=Deinococcus wulumuqiensis TaxID=980427 RepID=A0A345IL03_9DEIO|nr:siderophore-interacting protein [Deinococcus wulumuqiensis]AXH00376.1 siderophore-interacting protein [Deinococcus wulumuqiensis]